jgi:hypothetical protein
VVVENNTFINWQDRVIRHYLSVLPIHSFKFNHNTCINGMSYDGMISLGLIDSLGNGPFEIKNNLFIDNFSMGPDTDAVRQSEFTDSPDRDPNGGYQTSWIVARSNPTSHITPWAISNNYYMISDSGQAIRNLNAPYMHTPVEWRYTTEPILTSDIWRQLIASGGGVDDPFKAVNVSIVKVPQLMTKLLRWYFTPAGPGTGGNTVDNVGAGAGKKKDGTNNTPATNFIHDVAQNVWVYDYNRRTAEWYMDSLNCSYSSADAIGSSDGQTVGDPRWTFTPLVGIEENRTVPASYALDQNYPNPFNPSTKIEYSLPNAGVVTLNVFNTLGQVVATLVNERQEAGHYVVSLDGSVFSSGVYFYQISAGKYTATKKMMLVK